MTGYDKKIIIYKGIRFELAWRLLDEFMNDKVEFNKDIGVDQGIMYGYQDQKYYYVYETKTAYIVRKNYE